MNIKELRTKANLTQSELAAMLGVTQTCVGKWETAGVSPRASLMPRIAQALNCTIDELYGKGE